MVDRDAAPTCEALDLPTWTAPEGTDTPQGALARCKEVSAEFTAFLREHGLTDAAWVQVVGPQGSHPDAHRAWRTLPQNHWQHYLTRVTADDGTTWYVDWTARQFDPTAAHPQITPATDGTWTAAYEITDALDEFLALAAAEAATPAAAQPEPCPDCRGHLHGEPGERTCLACYWAEAD